MNRIASPTRSSVPGSRIRALNENGVAGSGDYVLHWMIAHRRTGWSYSLDRAVDWARELGKPLLVFEALRCGYRWASHRLHAFVVQGMADNALALADKPCTYYPYLEDRPGAGSGLLEALAARASIVVTDDFPCFFLPRMVDVASDRLSVRLEAVDSNGLLPMAATDRTFARAVDFRRFLQKSLAPHLAGLPDPDPLAGATLAPGPAVPAEILERWPAADVASLAAHPEALRAFPIDPSVSPVGTRGGQVAAARLCEQFVQERLARYAEGRRDVMDRSTSGLSPYLHFGHISAHQMFAAVVASERWSPDQVTAKATGSRLGWWGMSEPAESLLDQLVTWRELGYNFCARHDDYDRYESLPAWARATLEQHAADPRPHLYDLGQLERAETHDELWNAAQRELVRDGRIHNYLRMLWGKKIFEWSPDARAALEVMIELNNRYALDGRNPNSYSGIFWCLGRFDRAWGPERPIFGKIRFMTSENTRRKLNARGYLAEFGGGPTQMRL